jgi:hypothetical protein
MFEQLRFKEECLLRILFTAIIGLTLSTLCSANMLTNGSFESGNFVAGMGNTGMSLRAEDTNMTGWTITGAHDLAWLTNNAFNWTAQDGNRFLDLTGYQDTKPYNGISQVVNLAPGAYVLTFYIGQDRDNPVATGPMSVSVSAGNQANVVFTDSQTGTGNVWEKETLSFTASSGSTTISLTGLSSQGGQYLGLDNVDLEAGVAPPTTTPEPGTFGALLVVAFFAGLRALKGKRRSHSLV